MAQQMLALDEYLHAGYGTTVGLYGGGGHRVTVWGFDWDDTNNDYYTAIWITDSDDDKGGSPPRPDTLRRYTVTWDGTKWELGGGYTGWYLDRAMALEQRPIPAPGALILAGIGAVSIGWIRKRRSI